MTSWRELRDEAAGCTRCDLHQRATQTVFGEGPASAAIALAGEQPGDQEGKQGHPSAVLREPDGEGRDRAYAGLVADLVVAREAAATAATR